MSIATVQAVINGQSYPVALDADGYYTLDSTAPAISSIHQPGGYYSVQVTLTDDAGNVTTLDAEDAAFGEQLRLKAREKTKPTVTITFPLQRQPDQHLHADHHRPAPRQRQRR